MPLQLTLFVFLSYHPLLLNKVEVLLLSIKTAPSNKEENPTIVKLSHIRGMFGTLIEVPCAKADLSARFNLNIMVDGQIVKSLKADDSDVSNGLFKKIRKPTARLDLPSDASLPGNNVLTQSQFINEFVQAERNRQKATEDADIHLINNSFPISSRKADKRQVENRIKKVLRVYSATELTAERGSVQNSQTTSVLDNIVGHNGGVVKSSIETESRAEDNEGFWESVNKRVATYDEEGIKDILPNSSTHKWMRLS